MHKIDYRHQTLTFYPKSSKVKQKRHFAIVVLTC